jgi:hypothetical protein
VSSNPFIRLKQLFPQPQVLIGTVLAVNTDNTSTVQYPDGSTQRVRGANVAVGQPAFVRNGIVEGLAPARAATVIEI